MIGRIALRAALRQAFSAPRTFSTSAVNNRNVAVLGASGGIGQPVSRSPSSRRDSGRRPAEDWKAWCTLPHSLPVRQTSRMLHAETAGGIFFHRPCPAHAPTACCNKPRRLTDLTPPPSLLSRSQLSLLLKNDLLVTQLRLYDVRLAPGVAADIGHINTPAITTGYSPNGPEGGLEKALEGAEIIVIPAGVPRKPGMTRDDLFNVSSRPRRLCDPDRSFQPRPCLHTRPHRHRPTLPLFGTSQRPPQRSHLRLTCSSSPTPSTRLSPSFEMSTRRPKSTTPRSEF